MQGALVVSVKIALGNIAKGPPNVGSDSATVWMVGKPFSPHSL